MKKNDYQCPTGIEEIIPSNDVLNIEMVHIYGGGKGKIIWYAIRALIGLGGGGGTDCSSGCSSGQAEGSSSND